MQYHSIFDSVSPILSSLIPWSPSPPLQYPLLLQVRQICKPIPAGRKSNDRSKRREKARRKNIQREKE